MIFFNLIGSDRGWIFVGGHPFSSILYLIRKQRSDYVEPNVLKMTRVDYLKIQMKARLVNRFVFSVG